MSQHKTFRERHRELSAKSPMLGDLFLASPANRAGIAREEEAEQQTAPSERQQKIDKVRNLEQRGFTALAQLESLQLHGHALEAHIYEQANQLKLRTERERLTIESEPSEAA